VQKTLFAQHLYKILQKIGGSMESKNYLGKKVVVKMDRPLGSAHPKHGFIYPVNYGYIPNTVSGDGEELDAYVLGEHKPLDEFEGVVVAIIHRLNDDDDKLVVMAEGRNYTDEQIMALTEFQERFFKSVIIR
jgi:inorganic pyrophosphatase